MKLIVSGVPCCGKTFFGDWLKNGKAFTHVDLELQDRFRQQAIGKNLQNGFPSWVGTIAKDVIVTWGFPPNECCFNLIKEFQHAGFSAWWFDADLDIARIRYIQRNGEEAVHQFFDIQARKLRDTKTTLDMLYIGQKIETLNAQGYAPVEQTLEHIRNVEQVV